LIGIIAAFVCTQSISLPVNVRRGRSAKQFSWLKRLALDQRGVGAAPSLAGAMLVVHLDAPAPNTLRQLATIVRPAVRPADLIAPSASGYCVLLEGIDSEKRPRRRGGPRPCRAETTGRGPRRPGCRIVDDRCAPAQAMQRATDDARLTPWFDEPRSDLEAVRSAA
jgi:hypothetical protein